MSSIREVAKHAGVSPATVSRAFATPNLINEHTKLRVFESARTLDYCPPRLRTPRASSRSRSASEREKNTPDALGFQFFTATDDPNDTLSANTFYAPVLTGALAEASELGVNLLVHTTSRHRLMTEPPRMIREKAIGGMLLVGTTDPEILSEFAAHVRDIILVDHRDPENRFESIISDNYGGAYAATRYLLELGHTKIGFVLGGSLVGSFQFREGGFLTALFEAGLTPNRDWIIGVSETDEGLCAEIDDLLRLPSRPTALVVSNDHNALLVYRMCKEAGVRIPEDISVVGFDDIQFSSHADPPLTTVRVNKEYMGRYAVRRLWERLSNKSGDYTPPEGGNVPSISHVLPVELIIRQSCCPP